MEEGEGRPGCSRFPAAFPAAPGQLMRATCLPRAVTAPTRADPALDTGRTGFLWKDHPPLEELGFPCVVPANGSRASSKWMWQIKFAQTAVFTPTPRSKSSFPTYWLSWQLRSYPGTLQACCLMSPLQLAKGIVFSCSFTLLTNPFNFFFPYGSHAVPSTIFLGVGNAGKWFSLDLCVLKYGLHGSTLVGNPI